MNKAEKLENAVAKTLGAMAYETVYIHPTSSERFVEIILQGELASNPESVTKLFGKKFTVTASTYDPRSFIISKAR